MNTSNNFQSLQIYRATIKTKVERTKYQSECDSSGKMVMYGRLFYHGGQDMQNEKECCYVAKHIKTLMYLSFSDSTLKQASQLINLSAISN